VSTSSKGDQLEKQTFQVLQRELSAGRFAPFDPRFAKLRMKPKYWSPDREGTITFDLSLEAFRAGDSDRPLLTIIFECKNLSRLVSIDDIEEFKAKLDQVECSGSKKGVMVSINGFQPTVLKYARKQGVGLARVDSTGLKWDLSRLPTGDLDAFVVETQSRISDAIVGSDHFLRISAWHFSFDECLTTSWNAFLSAICGFADAGRATKSSSIPFVSRDEIADAAAGFRRVAASGDERLSVEQIAQALHTRFGFELVLDSVAPDSEAAIGVLGGIWFRERRIVAYSTGRLVRQRFTVAHEVGHLLLDHQRFFDSELCQQDDLEPDLLPNLEGLRRLEVQANMFATELLMPRSLVLREFGRLVEKYGLRDRGHGWLYVDGQAENQAQYRRTIAHLKSFFGVSRQAMFLRLLELKLVSGPGPH